MSERPLISVTCLNKNHAATIREALDSIFAQTVENLEVVLADGGSTDGSLEIIRSYPRVRLLDGTDRSRAEGVLRAVAAAEGRYIAFMTTTDGYVSQGWLATAAAHLDANPEIALVWGASIVKDGDHFTGTLYPGQFATGRPVARGGDWALGWIIGGLSKSYLPELNYCVRADLFKRLIAPDPNVPNLEGIDPILRAHFEFNRQGYQQAFLPVLANFGRNHPDQGQHSPQADRWLELYDLEKKRYVAQLLSGEITHVCRAPDGSILSTVPRWRVAFAFGVSRALAFKPVREILRPFRRLARRIAFAG